MAEQRPYSSNDLIAGPNGVAQRRLGMHTQDGSRPNTSVMSRSSSSSIATVHRRVVLRRGTLSFPQDLLHPSTPPKSRIRLKTREITATTSCDISPKNLPFDPRKTAIATMGKNSPTALPASTQEPRDPWRMLLSRRIGRSVPSAVVVSPSATGIEGPWAANAKMILRAKGHSGGVRDSQGWKLFAIRASQRQSCSKVASLVR